MTPIAPLAFLLSLATSPTEPYALQDTPAPPPERAELEAEFGRAMTGAKLVGFFTDDRMPAGSPLKEDSYLLKTLEKLDGDRWRITAGMEYGGKSFAFPIVVDVKWAGDTPMLQITDLAIPLLGTFTARILFYGDRYAGTWSAPDHGGTMFGRIVRAEAATESAPAPAEGEGGGGDDDGEDYVHWPSFRGRFARGVSEGWATAEEFDVESGKNVGWRIEVPGLAHSSPVIFGDRLYLTSAIKEGEPAELKVGLYGDIAPVKDEGPHQLVVMCFDKRDGKLLWQHTAWEGVPAFPRHTKGSFAASTPAADEGRVVAFFGSEGLYCYDERGELQWKKEFGPLSSGFYMVPAAQWGFGSSPVIHEGRVYVQCDVIGDSFVAALDLASGDELWRTPREEVPTWSTPTVASNEGRSQLICNGFKHIGGYDLATGEELWKLVGGGDIPVPTPVVAHDLIFVTNAHGMLAPIYAIEIDAIGEVSFASDQMSWSDKRRGTYMQTPLVYGEEIYFCNDGGVVNCYDARTGKEHYRERLGEGGSGFTASGVAADGKLYYTSEIGNVHIVAAGSEFEPLTANELGEECMATPAISEGVIYWRTRGHLVAVAEK